jgi:hypothetical protein
MLPISPNKQAVNPSILVPKLSTSSLLLAVLVMILMVIITVMLIVFTVMSIMIMPITIMGHGDMNAHTRKRMNTHTTTCKKHQQYCNQKKPHKTSHSKFN